MNPATNNWIGHRVAKVKNVVPAREEYLKDLADAVMFRIDWAWCQGKEWNWTTESLGLEVKKDWPKTALQGIWKMNLKCPIKGPIGSIIVERKDEFLGKPYSWSSAEAERNMSSVKNWPYSPENPYIHGVSPGPKDGSYFFK
jgi:hypothetical protein